MDIAATAAATGVRVEGNGGNDTFRITGATASDVRIDGGLGFGQVVWSPWLLPPGGPRSGVPPCPSLAPGLFWAP